MEAWCLVIIALSATAILAGIRELQRSRGMRIVPGRTAAVWAYVLLFLNMVIAGFIGALLVRIYPIVSGLQPMRGLVTICLAVPPVLLAGLVYHWAYARSLGRSVVFHNVRRDDLAYAVAAALRQMDIPVDHQLRTFSDAFAVPGGRLIVRSAVNMSRLEWIGPDGPVRDQLVDLAISKLSSDLTARGRQLIDERPGQTAFAS